MYFSSVVLVIHSFANFKVLEYSLFLFSNGAFQSRSSLLYSFFQFCQHLKVRGFIRLSKKQLSFTSFLPLPFSPPVPFWISGRDPLVVVECCDAPRPICQVSASY